MNYRLHGFFRSSASWRVRIALNLKGITYQDAIHHLRQGDHRKAEYLRINPQGLLPALELPGGTCLTQSLAICEYLEEICPEPPILPDDAALRARVRAFAQVIAMDVHPIQNLKILNRVRSCGLGEDAVEQWACTTIDEGLQACEALLADRPETAFAFGNRPTIADICLIPQLGNARRFGVNLCYPRLIEIEERCNALPAFAAALPVNQIDAE